MTSTTYTPEAARGTYTEPRPAASSALAGSRLSFGGTLKSERIKLSSLRSFRITLIITLLAGIGLSFLAALAWTSSLSYDGTDLGSLPAEALQSFLLTVASFASPFLALIFGVLGVFAISSEYSSGMILSTLAAVPKRTPVFVAKAFVLALISGLTALVLTVVGLGIGVVFIPEAAAQLLTPVVISGVLGTIAYLVLIALLGFGIAAVLRSTAGGIAVVAGVTFVLPVGFQILALTEWAWVPIASNYLPLNLGSVLALGLVDQQPDPGFWIALIAMAVWALVPMILGNLLLKTRDAK